MKRTINIRDIGNLFFWIGRYEWLARRDLVEACRIRSLFPVEGN